MSLSREDTAAVPLSAAEAFERDRAADRARGIALMVLGAGLYAVMDALVKWLSDGYPVLQILFFRSLIAFVPLSVVLLRNGSLADLRTRRPLAHLVRSLIGFVSLASFFYAFGNMPLANVIAIGFAAPLFVTAMSMPLLGERVGPRRWMAVLAGFVGVLIMVRPDTGAFDRVALVALGATVLYALVIIQVRKMSRTESSSAIVFYYALISTLIAGAFMPFQWVTPGREDLALLIAVGLVGGVSQIAMTNAFRLAEVAIIAPFDYTTMIWAAALGFVVWGELPGLNVWIGVAIVTASGLYILYREARLGLPRGIARRLQARR